MLVKKIEERKIIMSNNKKLSYNLIIKNFVRVITIILCIFYLLSKDISPVIGGVVFLGTSLGIDIILKLIRIKLTNIIDIIIQSFIFLSLFLGKMYNIYAVFPWWDSFLHFISGIIVGFVGILVFKILVSEKIYFTLPPLVKSLISFLFAVTSSALWEVWEFAGDKLFGFDSQLNSLTDTMTDICVCILGGVIISVIIYEFYKKEKFKFVGKTVEAFSKINIKEEDNKFR